MKLTFLPISACALISLASTACDREQRSLTDEPVTTAPERTQDGLQQEGADDQLQPVRGRSSPAVEAIAQARCAREQRCNNIGADREYASEQVCMARVQADWSTELSARECPGGVNQSELNECLQEIRNDDCNNPIDTLGRFAACRESDLCNAIP